MKTSPVVIGSVLACLIANAAFAEIRAAPDSPFAAPLTAEEAVSGTGCETETPLAEWLPPEYGLQLGMGKGQARLARPGLRRDGESGWDCLCQRLGKKDGRGDLAVV